MIRRASVTFLAALLGCTSPSCRSGVQTPSTSDAQLLVVVAVDQMRFDYLDRYKAFWKAGLARLMSEGAVFDHGFYPYLSTITCAGHATISTGAFPATHGIIANEWFQRSVGRRMSCTDDPTVKSLPYNEGPAEKIGHSAHRLRIPTIGDRLRAASPQSRVVSLSMKPRSAVMLGGHGGTVTWFSDANVWSTSTAYSAGAVPEVQAYVKANPVDANRGEIWNRVYEPARYSGADEGLGERPKEGWTRLFAHPLAGAPGTPPHQFYDLWERSPFSDVALGSMAAHLVQSMKLGQRGVVDLLAVGFSALDSVGHDFGPDSHEVQDALIRLDQTLGLLLEVLDKTVGRDRYVLGLSADHGVAQIPEVARAQGKDAGRILNADVRKVAEAAMTKAHGPGPHVAWVEYADIYLSDAMRTRAVTDWRVLMPLIDAVAAMPGVMRVFPAFGLEKKRGSTDPVERAAALTYYPGESGDVIVVLKEHWINSGDNATTHGTMHSYDQHVPVIFFGKAIKDGRFSDPVTPADLAPTLASIVKLPMPGVDGKVLKKAIR